jgi:hypothetical protein
MEDENPALVEAALGEINALDKDIALADYELRTHSTTII